MAATKLTGLTHTKAVLSDLSKLIAKAGNLYVAGGEIEAAQVPADNTELEALIADSTGVFQPVGKGSESIGKFSAKPTTVPTDFHTLITGYTVDGNFENLTFTPEVLAWMDSDESRGILTFMWISRDKKTFVLFKGVSLVPELDGDLKGSAPFKSNFAFNRNCDKLSEVLELGVLTA